MDLKAVANDIFLSVLLNILKPDSRRNEMKCFLNAFITVYSVALLNNVEF